MQPTNLQDKYYIIKSDYNPNSLFSSFRMLKKNSYIYNQFGQRPPYPIINSNPTISEVFYNLNKSDFLVGLFFVGLGFGISIYATRPAALLELKFSALRYTMFYFYFLGITSAMNCSYYRLIGFLDNGLRWRHKEMFYSKYDFTTDFENNTIFKHFRQRYD